MIMHRARQRSSCIIYLSASTFCLIITDESFRLNCDKLASYFIKAIKIFNVPPKKLETE